MNYTPITPFRRPVDSALLKYQSDIEQDLSPNGVNKWEAIRELGTARLVFGLSDRDIAVLQVLVSFYQNTILGENEGGLIVYPSNKVICERLNGMPSSTMRRHLWRLVQSGVVVRRDSPNGKRYARRYGDERVAYGFDLSPLVTRFSEFCQAAEATRHAQERYKRLRESVSLMRRDLAALSLYGAEIRPDLSFWADLSSFAVLAAHDLRRKLTFADLEALKERLNTALVQVRDVLEPSLDNSETENMSTNESAFEQHYQNSNTDSYDFEPCLENAKGAGGALVTKAPLKEQPDKIFEEVDDNLPNIPLGLVLTTCHEFKTYHDSPVRHWHQLVRAADTVRPMMGISPSAWEEAQNAMGPEEAAVVVLAMLERFENIKSPGGYLRTLTQKAALGQFSCGPMIMALLRREVS